MARDPVGPDHARGDHVRPAPLRAFQPGLILLIGLAILFFQINGVPDLTAQRIPISFSGGQADAAVGPIGANITDLQATVAAMSAKIDALCAAVARQVPPVVSPNPCITLTAATPAP
jgi:hypothetical protein